MGSNHHPPGQSRMPCRLSYTALSAWAGRGKAGRELPALNPDQADTKERRNRAAERVWQRRLGSNQPLPGQSRASYRWTTPLYAPGGATPPGYREKISIRVLYNEGDNGDRGGTRTLKPHFWDPWLSRPGSVANRNPCHIRSPGPVSGPGEAAHRGVSPSDPLIRGMTRSWGFHSYIMPHPKPYAIYVAERAGLEPASPVSRTTRLAVGLLTCFGHLSK